MGSTRDVMQIFADREIRAHFPKNDGWGCRQVPSPNHQDISCILSRDTRSGTQQIALVVTYDEVPSVSSLDNLTTSMNKKLLKGRYLIVPKNTDTSSIPKEIRVIFMDSFGFIEGNLIWLTKKKNARHYPVQETPCVAEVAPAVSQPNAA